MKAEFPLSDRKREKPIRNRVISTGKKRHRTLAKRRQEKSPNASSK